MTQSLDEIVENFSLFDDWEERYRYLIDLGRALPQMDDARKSDDAIVKGCTSRVWLYVTENQGRLQLDADSDAHIVRGLIALLLVAYNDKTPAEIGAVDIDAFFQSLGLDQHLSPNRRNGFYAMVERVKALALVSTV